MTIGTVFDQGAAGWRLAMVYQSDAEMIGDRIV